jgi:alpha-mannosidase
MRLLVAERPQPEVNPNWADESYKSKVVTSSFYPDPPWGYNPSNAVGNDLKTGWQTDKQLSGAWLEIEFPETRPVQELWIFSRPLPYDVIGEDPYKAYYSRSALYAAPRVIHCELSDGTSIRGTLPEVDCFQILSYPKAVETASCRIQIEEVWAKPGVTDTGLGKIRIFPRRHAPSFEIYVHPMYDVHDGRPVQSATLRLINPGLEVTGVQLVISQEGNILMKVPLHRIPAQAAISQAVWIPAPFADTAMDFKILTANSAFGTIQTLRVPTYHSYFDRGTFALNCTCHNDLGWLDTQAKTADYRSSEIILPVMKLLAEYPEYCYSMESTTYLMEFMERHPEKREEMDQYMREKRFTWGASYVQCLEVHVGPEKLVRQFYFGRRWLQKTFPGVDTRFYVKSDPPALTLQMPQILAKAGVKYLIQGRMAYGYYRWEAPDGSSVLAYAYKFAVLESLLNPKSSEGWLQYADEREYYYAPRELPPNFIYDYTSDYLPPQPALLRYARDENDAMQRFAQHWNEHCANEAGQQIHPPRIVFDTPESFLDKFSEHPLDILTLKGDWPINWAYYDEPGHREGLLAGREAHNRILAAERLYTALDLTAGFDNYPLQTFTEAWKANCWPDHGWGGNRGTLTDKIYIESYEKSKKLADKLLAEAGSRVVNTVKKGSNRQIPIVVFNPLSWERTDVVHCKVQATPDLQGLVLRDEAGKEVPYEISEDGTGKTSNEIIFVAEATPSVGYRTFYLEPGTSSPAGSSPSSRKRLTGDTAENRFFKVTFGAGGLKSLYDKRSNWEVLRTDKFDGGEVLQFTAPGYGWDDTEIVTIEDFDKTSNHFFAFTNFSAGPVCTTAGREAQFEHFTLREHFHLYHLLDRIDIELELVNWDGRKERELRAVFPINLDDAALTYEVPFGKVELGKDEFHFSMLPRDPLHLTACCGMDLPLWSVYGGDHPLPYREAINWIDGSAIRYLGHGCLLASDCTVHLFRDETTNPVTYPVLQHVLISTRKSHAWNPDYWFTQAGNHRYRMSLLPHAGDWRLRYREAIGFNYGLAAFVGVEGATSSTQSLEPKSGFLRIEPANLILTAMKKSEDDDRVVIRFYEAEGYETQARLRLSKPIKQAWKTSLIEEDQEALQPTPEGSLDLKVKPWEIVTLKVAV